MSRFESSVVCMALRIRKDGRILCAAMHKEEPEDTYIEDQLHYEMSVIYRVITTDEHHEEHGEWWWSKNFKLMG